MRIFKEGTYDNYISGVGISQVLYLAIYSVPYMTENQQKEVVKMEIDYRKAFGKLVEQIKTEKRWAEEDKSDEIKYLGKPDRYTSGRIFAYRSMLELAEKLEIGE